MVAPNGGGVPPFLRHDSALLASILLARPLRRDGMPPRLFGFS